MDPRIREHASILADHSVELEPGDDVVVAAPPAAEDLVVALHEEIGDRGANPVSLSSLDRASRAYLRAADPEDFELPAHKMALYEAMDAFVAVRAQTNATEKGDVDPATQAAHRRANRPALEERLSKRWVVTQFPATGNAQLAEMSCEAYENFVWDAVNKDWAAQREHQADLVDILEGAEAVRVVSGETTDVRLPIHGNPPINDYGENNLPGGEVFTAPVPDGVEGEVLFDMPLYHQGREIEDVHLRFEDGEVVEHSAAKNEETLTSVLETDEGARRLGELGIGMNRDIDRFTYNM
ncbi:MAG: aminopeptidase, partial [Halobacteriaceae archaeon]